MAPRKSGRPPRNTPALREPARHHRAAHAAVAKRPDHLAELADPDPGDRVDQLVDRPVGLAPMRDGDHAHALALRRLGEDQRKASVAGDEPDGSFIHGYRLRDTGVVSLSLACRPTEAVASQRSESASSPASPRARSPIRARDDCSNVGGRSQACSAHLADRFLGGQARNGRACDRRREARAARHRGSRGAASPRC